MSEDHSSFDRFWVFLNLSIDARHEKGIMSPYKIQSVRLFTQVLPFVISTFFNGYTMAEEK